MPFVLKPEDIAYVKADGNYAQIGLAGGDTEEIFERLGEIEKTLPSEIFLRIGKSLIINRGYVRRINTKKSLLEITTPQTSYLLGVPEKGIKLLAQELATSLNPR
jgi:DNA-binding LytR/AlgR family response regulator